MGRKEGSSKFYGYDRVLYIQDSEEKIIDENWVPHSTLWLINEVGKIVGAANIRHKLIQMLLNSGGHIGYGIRPSHRRKGYATILLSLALQHARKLGLSFTMYRG